MSRFEIRFGLLGLGLMVAGGVLHGFTGSAILALLFLPAGTLLMAGVSMIQKRRGEMTPRRALGMTMIGAGCLGAAVLAFFTPDRFLGWATGSQLRPFFLPSWLTLLRLHFGWTAAALLVASGARLAGRASIERCLWIGLAVFACYPAIALACYLVVTLAG
jgi:hypothetical protein